MRGGVGEQAERRSGVFRMREPEEAGDDLNVGVHRYARGGEVLRPAVNEDDEQCDEVVGEACAVRGHSSLMSAFLASFASFSLRTLRLSASSPTGKSL